MIKNIIKRIPFIKSILNRIRPAGMNEVIDQLNINDHPLCIDIGANTGQTIEWLIRKFSHPTIYAFEPTGKLNKELVKKFGKKTNIQIVNLALSDRVGTFPLYTSKFSATNSLLQPNIDMYKKYNPKLATYLNESEIENVVVDTFENWYNKNLSGQVIDIFKTDTQGNDLDVIEGGKNILPLKVKILISEIHFKQFYNKGKEYYKLFGLMNDLNFELLNLVDNTYLNRFSLIESNAIFLNKYFFDKLI